MINAYRIGVHLAMTQNVSAALGLIAGQMLGLHRQIGLAKAGFNSLGLAIAGAGAAFAGTQMLQGIGAMISAGEKLVHQQSLLRMAGEDNASVARATQAAWQASFDVQGTNVAANMRVLGDLRGLFGSLREAEQVLPQFARFQRTISAVTGQTDEKAGGVMAQAMDLMGAVQFDPKTGALVEDRFNAYMNQAVAAIINNRGRVGPQQIRAFVQQAGPAANVMNPEQLFADMSVLIESMGGHRAGTGIAAIQRQFLNGIMTDRTYDVLRMIGMATGPTTTIKPKERAAVAAAMSRELEGGATIDPVSLVKVAPKGIRGSDRIARGDYAGFVLEELVPQIEKFLRQSGQEVNQQNILNLLTRAGGVGPGQRTAAQIYLSRQQIERERNMQRPLAQDPQGALRRLQETDPVAARQRLREAWTNLMTAVGHHGVPMAVRAMNMLASGIERLTRLVVAHPRATRTLLGIAAGLGAALVVIGGLAIFAAAVAAIGGAGIASTILAVGAALGGLAYAATQVNWPRMMADLNSSFSQLWAWLQTAPQRAWDAITGGLQAAAGYLAGVYERARAELGSSFGQLGAAVAGALSGWAASISAGWTDLTTQGATAVQGWVASVQGWATSIGAAIQGWATSVATAWTVFESGVTSAIAGWISSVVTGIGQFTSTAASVIQAVVDWLVGIPRRILEGVTGGAAVTPGAREGLLAPSDPMGGMGGMGGEPVAPLSGASPTAAPSAFIPPAQGNDVAVQTAVYLDGRIIADVVSQHQGRSLNQAPSAPSFVDRRRGGLSADVVAA